ncbi:DUF2254 domain-containing protein [Sphingomonas sp. Leaf343]|uniref:DUF2254 domain-containing protein n=1 Tax=Sphingomonas sp. Leaf343 TaxID=1736345 RepID=UPI0006F5FD86|nr:DUF2254 domain-containing protein [Sphingomonas sp. Leaf343]KQR82127.1 hypothetical protein ASG07_10500 [Sphingomonas sp. Leaf343]
MGHWSWMLSRIVRQIWFRAAIISALSIALAVAAALVGPYLPYRFGGELGQDSVGTILQIMASSMLAVTTFSLTAMVSAYSSATQLATPRATQLMISDPTSQNALSTFLGAFVFSVVGIIGLQTSAYGEDGRIILFAGTVLVVAVVVVTLLRWIAHITAFGRMADVIDRVEDAAAKSMVEFAAAPFMGGKPPMPIPGASTALCSDAVGYVAHVDIAALARVANAADLSVHVVALPGTLVHPGRALLRVEGAVDEEARAAMIRAFSVERHRSFDQDPRLGLIALSEIGSRALSPAVNDPGTAIEVLNALHRVLANLPAERPSPAVLAERASVHVPSHDLPTMLVDAFRPLIRDGGASVEVMIRLTKTLAALHDRLPMSRVAIRRLADDAARRVGRTIEDDDDRAAFRAAHDGVWS